MNGEGLFYGIVAIIIVVIVGGIWLFKGFVGNRQLIDTNYTFTKAIINTGSETIEVDVEKWKDYDGEQIQIISKDGTVYLVSTFNTILKSK